MQAARHRAMKRKVKSIAKRQASNKRIPPSKGDLLKAKMGRRELEAKDPMSMSNIRKWVREELQTYYKKNPDLDRPDVYGNYPRRLDI